MTSPVVPQKDSPGRGSRVIASPNATATAAIERTGVFGGRSPGPSSALGLDERESHPKWNTSYDVTLCNIIGYVRFAVPDVTSLGVRTLTRRPPRRDARDHSYRASSPAKMWEIVCPTA